MSRKIQRFIRSKHEIAGCKRVIRIENVWLLYNFETLCNYFYTRKAAVADALYESRTDTLPEYYQVLRGTITVELDEPQQ